MGIKKLFYPDHFWHLFRRLLRRRNFKKYALTGTDFVFSAKSNCRAQKPGQIRIGDHCRIYGKLESQAEGKITVGDYTAIHEHSVIGSVESVTIGSYVMISNHVHIYDNNNHPTEPELRRQICLAGHRGELTGWKYADHAPVVIEDDVWIGEYAAVMKGVTIGQGSVIAAHAVVTHSVPPYTVVAGNPAHVVKELKHESK